MRTSMEIREKSDAQGTRRVGPSGDLEMELANRVRLGTRNPLKNPLLPHLIAVGWPQQRAQQFLAWAPPTSHSGNSVFFGSSGLLGHRLRDMQLTNARDRSTLGPHVS